MKIVYIYPSHLTYKHSSGLHTYYTELCLSEFRYLLLGVWDLCQAFVVYFEYQVMWT